MKDEVSPWTLGRTTTTLKMGSPNVSIATNMGTWQKNTKLENVSNARKKDTLPRTAREHN